MEAIILAGGFGTRLRSVISDVPKPMAPIEGTPFLEILLRSLKKKGFNRVILSVGYLSESISQYFGNNFLGMELLYAIENKPLGTGGGVRLAMELCVEDHCFVFNGDTFIDLEVNALESMWSKKKYPIIVGRKVDETARYGNIIVFDGVVKIFSEKNSNGPGIINAGCYVLPKGILKNWTAEVNFSLEKDYFIDAVKSYEVGFFETNGIFIDIGVPEDFERAQIVLKKFNE